MPKRLETYLREVESYLASLPEIIRQSETREIAGHLQQNVDDLTAQGLSEDDASTRATQRFGSARSVGLHLRDTWERNRAPLPVAFAVTMCNWLVYGISFVSCEYTILHLLATDSALSARLFPYINAWMGFTVYVLPFALNFALGRWGGRRVALAVVIPYLPLLLLTLPRGVFYYAYMNASVGIPASGVIQTVGLALLGAWLGDHWHRKRRFSFVANIASADEAATKLAISDRMRQSRD